MTAKHGETSGSLNVGEKQQLSPEGAIAGSRRLTILGAVLIVLAFLLAGWGGVTAEFFWRSYLLNWLFVLSIALGAIAFVILQHATRAGWSVALRRVAELLATPLGLLALLFLPVALAMGLLGIAVYPWIEPKHAETAGVDGSGFRSPDAENTAAFVAESSYEHGLTTAQYLPMSAAKRAASATRASSGLERHLLAGDKQTAPFGGDNLTVPFGGDDPTVHFGRDNLADTLAGHFRLQRAAFGPLSAGMTVGKPSEISGEAPHHGSTALAGPKALYLNFPFFMLRGAFYLVVWWVLMRWYVRNSIAQDSSGDIRPTVAMERWSGPALIALGFTATFAAFDWVMSLDPHWYSTVFGVHFISGCLIAGLCGWVLGVFALQQAGYLTVSVTSEHYHDLGKLLFAFVIFWAYIAFSQFMLIWYGNIPEETVWYQLRLHGVWGWVAAALIVAHFLVPFFGLLPYWVKRRKDLMAFWATWLLLMHWLDLCWLILPGTPGGDLPGIVCNVLLLAGFGCVYVGDVLHKASECVLIPVGDPRLGESLAFENIG